MRLLDTLRTSLRAPLEKLVAAEVARQVEQQKLDALYKYRWHGDRSRLHIPETAVVNNALFNVSGGEITLGEYVFFGHDVAILTGTHDIEKFGLERQMTFPRSDRKSTRLNSSHSSISYAVFCLKKKKRSHAHRRAPDSPHAQPRPA